MSRRNKYFFINPKKPLGGELVCWFFWFLGGFFIANSVFGRDLARPKNFSWEAKNNPQILEKEI
jgi:hypothetical protein